jgi:hypothetical protein
MDAPHGRPQSPYVSAVEDRPKTADEHSKIQTERWNKLFVWCDALLAKLPSKLPFAKQIEQATTIDEVRKIVFGPLSESDSLELDLAIQDAFYPPDGTKRDDCFAHMRPGTLKRILKKRFSVKKADRELEINKAAQSKAPADKPLVAHVAGVIYEFLTACFPLEEWERLYLTGWALQTHFINRFTVIVRLLLTSLEPGCGKTSGRHNAPHPGIRLQR